MSKYIFNISNVHKGQIFATFKELFKALTGRIPPTGSTLKEVKKRMSRYVKYAPACEHDPQITAKWPVIVLEVYDPPLAFDSQRGCSGEYADKLRPLILSTGEFEGKWHRLYNDWEVFHHYFQEELKKLPTWKQNHIGKDLSIFSATSDDMPAGERLYKTLLAEKMKDAMKRSLDSLYKHDALNFYRGFYKIIPCTTVRIPGSEYQTHRPKETHDIRAWQERKAKLIKEFSSFENCKLDFALITTLDIYSSSWDNPEWPREQYEPLRQFPGKGDYAIRASEQQAKAIENMESFFIQLALRQYYHLGYLPPKVPKLGAIMNNRALFATFNKIKERYTPLLVNCQTYWKEVEFSVKTEHQLLAVDKQALVDKLTYSFLTSMDEKMHSIEKIDKQGHISYPNDILSPHLEEGDIKPLRFGCYSRTMPVALDRSLSASAFHAHLKKLYP